MLNTNLFDFDQDIIDTATDHWRSCVRAGGGHFERMLWHVHLYDLPEHFMKLSM